MAVHVVTTIGQHPIGMRVHIDNLVWAVDLPHRLHVQTFREWKLEDPRVEFLLYRSPTDNPLHYFNFYDFVAGYLQKILSENDVVLFTQQDILFHRKIGGLIEESISQKRIIVNFSMLHQYSLYKPTWRLSKPLFRKVFPPTPVYPRIWDGGVIIPASVLLPAIEKGVSLGHKPSAFKPRDLLYEEFRDLLLQTIMKNQTGKLCSVIGYIESVDAKKTGPDDRYGHDIMFELLLYCYCNNVPYRYASRSPFTRYSLQLGDYAVHMHYPEKAHRESAGRVYDHPELLNSVPHYMRSSLGAVVFMYYLSGVGIDLSRILPFLTQKLGRSLLRKQIEYLSIHASEWMDPETIRRFKEMKAVVDASHIFSRFKPNLA